MSPLESSAHASLSLFGAFYLWNNNSVKAFLMFLAFLTAVVSWLIVCEVWVQYWTVWAWTELGWLSMPEVIIAEQRSAKVYSSSCDTHWERYKAGRHAVTVYMCLCVCVSQERTTWDWWRVLDRKGMSLHCVCVCACLSTLHFFWFRGAADSGFLFSLTNRPGCWLAEGQNKSLNALKCAGVAYGGGRISHKPYSQPSVPIKAAQVTTPQFVFCFFVWLSQRTNNPWIVETWHISF